MGDLKPVRVVHLRNVTSDITQAQVMEVAQQFGTVEKFVMLKTKNQAIMQFATVAEATAFIRYYTTHHLRLGQRCVYVSYSRHSEISPVCFHFFPPDFLLSFQCRDSRPRAFLFFAVCSNRRGRTASCS